ncbi:hypothetical protein C0J52_02436, partial [Blattella germanica]
FCLKTFILRHYLYYYIIIIIIIIIIISYYCFQIRVDVPEKSVGSAVNSLHRQNIETLNKDTLFWKEMSLVIFRGRTQSYHYTSQIIGPLWSFYPSTVTKSAKKVFVTVICVMIMKGVVLVYTGPL